MNPPTFREIKDVIDGVVVVNLDTFNDHRGLNYEGYNEDVYSQHPAFKALVFRVDAFSRSQKNVLRGFHGDKFNYKLIQCLSGTVKFFLLDYRPESPTYKNTQGYILEGDNPYKFLI